MQMVEIAKAVSYNAKLIIMDEPSSSLTEREEQQLFTIIRRLKAEGRSIIYISHRLEEIFEVADTVTVFRDGTNVGEAAVKDITTEQLIAMMVGRPMDDLFPKIDTDKEGVVLKVEHLSHHKYFKNVSFEVRKGEILGFAGLVGAGRTEVMETIFGIRPHTEGQIYLHGKPVEIHNPGEAINMGISFLTEDRRGTGIFPLLSIDTNIAIPNYDKYLTKLGLVDQKAVDEACAKFVEKIEIKTPSLKQKIMNLSGGNQQKVLLARWLMTEPDVLILDEPTRGIDVGAKAEIYQLMSELAAQGKCIIMVSSELPEVIGMSDRIVVMHEGKITGILDNGPDITQEVLMRYATGTDDDF
jgi:methyl-galactoside transport system ATP-binding protein/inositol transport system ATP-binding protein